MAGNHWWHHRGLLPSFISEISRQPNLSCSLPIPFLLSYAFLGGGAVKHPGVGAPRRQWPGLPCWLRIQKHTTRSRHRSSRQRCTSWHWHSSQEHWQPTYEWIPVHCIARDEREHCWYQGILTWRTENGLDSRTSAWTNSVRTILWIHPLLNNSRNAYIVALDGTRLFSTSQSSRILRSALVSRSPTRMYWKTCPLPSSNSDANTFITQRISTSTILTLPMR